MVLGIYVLYDQQVVFNGNYSNVSGFKFTGTVYSNSNNTSPFNLTDYTLTLRLYKENGQSDYFNRTCTITSATDGTFYISIASGTLPPAGFYNMSLELTKSGTLVTQLNRTELLIKRGPVS